MGPSLITAPEIIKSVFRAAGKHIADYLELIKLEPYYRIYFHDKTYLDYSGDTQTMKAQMAAFNAGDAQNYDRFMQDCRKIYEAVIVDGLGSTPFNRLQTMLNFLPRALKLKAILPGFSFVKHYFKDARHRFTFSFHPLFIGGNPFRAPSVYLMIPYLEKVDGVWFTAGGMYSLVQAFARIFEEVGGVINTNAEVTEIVVQNGHANGVIANGKFHRADAVISNADWAHTQKNLIQPEHRRKWTNRRVDKLDYSMSAFLLYLGVRKQYPELQHHTIMLSPRYKELIRDIFDHKILAEDFSMYLHAPTKTDATMAPDGCESLYVLVPVPNLAGNIDWPKMAKPFAEKILKYLEEDFGLQGLRANLDVLEIFTPEHFKQRRNSYLGTPWGVEPKLTQTAYFRPHNRSEEIQNLYFVGAGTHPGAGLPGVLLTAEATEKLVLADLGLPKAREVVHEFIAEPLIDA
jgi:phytoene desaturase